MEPRSQEPLTSGLLSKLSYFTDMLAWPLRTSHYLELVNPLWTTHALQARVEKVWDETKDARTLTLRPGLNWRGHRAGQHVRVGIPVNGMHYTRTYTISSPPERDDDCITITVKAHPGGRISTHLVRQIKVGSYLPIGLPQGEFMLPDATPVQPLFISAGSGITPIISMLRSLVARDRLPPTVHIHYAPHDYDVIFGKELKALAEKHPHYQLHLVFTQELGGQATGNHRFTAAQLDDLCPDWRHREVYACGPASLLAAVESHWENAGLSRHVHVERFRAAFSDIPSDAVGGRVSFARSELVVDADSGTNLLRVAEDAGLNPTHGCRMGICHTCDATLKSGCVRDLRNGNVINEAGQLIQICVCAAAGDCEIDL